MRLRLHGAKIKMKKERKKENKPHRLRADAKDVVPNYI
jgi:hypothetical protein